MKRRTFIKDTALLVAAASTGGALKAAEKLDNPALRQAQGPVTGILLDNSNPGITVTGIGVNGAALPSYLKCEDFGRDLEMVRPDLVIFGIGINDASGKEFHKDDFIRRYKTLVSRIKAVNPDCALLFIILMNQRQDRHPSIDRRPHR